VLTCPISLAFDRVCRLVLIVWRPPTMKLISRLAFWNAPLWLPPLGGGGGDRSIWLLSRRL
jgi:hypothetical protein